MQLRIVFDIYLPIQERKFSIIKHSALFNWCSKGFQNSLLAYLLPCITLTATKWLKTFQSFVIVLTLRLNIWVKYVSGIALRIEILISRYINLSNVNLY